MRLRLHRSLCLLFTAWISAQSAWAQSPIISKISSNGQEVTVDVPANTSPSTPLIFYYVSKGNVTSRVGVQVRGPAGLKTTVEASQVKGSALATLSKGNFYKVYLNGTLGSSKRSATAAPRRSAAVHTRLSSSECYSLPSVVVQILLQRESAAVGHSVTQQEYCSKYADGGSGSPGNGGDEGSEVPGGSGGSGNSSGGETSRQPIDERYGNATGFLQKDNCSNVRDYVVKVEVSLAGVSADALAQGFSVSASVQEAEYSGPRPATIKPVSDGMFAPAPLFLAPSLGFGGQWVNLVSWNKNQPRIVLKQPATASPVFYRGLFLVRVIASKLIAGRGERANFEVTNGSSVYNVCLKRARVRQRVNGYPG